VKVENLIDNADTMYTLPLYFKLESAGSILMKVHYENLILPK
jgi:hypothetical protein